MLDKLSLQKKYILNNSFFYSCKKNLINENPSKYES